MDFRDRFFFFIHGGLTNDEVKKLNSLKWKTHPRDNGWVVSKRKTYVFGILAINISDCLKELETIIHSFHYNITSIVTENSERQISSNNAKKRKDAIDAMKKQEVKVKELNKVIIYDDNSYYQIVALTDDQLRLLDWLYEQDLVNCEHQILEEFEFKKI